MIVFLAASLIVSADGLVLASGVAVEVVFEELVGALGLAGADAAGVGLVVGTVSAEALEPQATSPSDKPTTAQVAKSLSVSEGFGTKSSSGCIAELAATRSVGSGRLPGATSGFVVKASMFMWNAPIWF